MLSMNILLSITTPTQSNDKKVEDTTIWFQNFLVNCNYFADDKKKTQMSDPK